MTTIIDFTTEMLTSEGISVVSTGQGELLEEFHDAYITGEAIRITVLHIDPPICNKEDKIDLQPYEYTPFKKNEPF